VDAAAQLSALIDAFQALDTSSEPERARSLLAQAAQLVDRNAQPQKWAALRGLYADLCGDDADEAIAAYRDALTVWQRDDGTPFSHCHARLGELLLDRALARGEGTEAALEHLDAALPGDPTVARKAAFLWAARPLGDPYENWTRRRAALDVAVAGIDRHAEPAAWARAMNELALALGEEPGADFREAIEARLARHDEALAALVDRRSSLALEIRLQLSECHAMRVVGIGQANRVEAATLARDVLSDCDATTPTTIVWRALLATVVALDAPPYTPESRDEMASLLERAAALAPAGSLDEATIHSFHVNLALARVDDGEHEAIAALVAHAQAALRILDPDRDATTRASIGQRLGEGHVAVGDYVAAQAALDVALADRERGLARATSLPGRREALFALGDTAALAAWCAIRRGEAFEAVALLERGRSRLWRPEAPALTESTLAACVPAGGAVLLPVFASGGGAVVIVVHDAAGLRCEIVALQDFGRDEMMALQRGHDPAALGGWLLAYARRIGDPQGWQQTIAQTCDTLRRMVWVPVLAKLRALGVADDAELVWLPQGGSSVFPFHAAVAYATDGDTATTHSIRYAPSLRAIAAIRAGEGRDAVLVVDPTGDLPGAELESEWIRRATPNTPWRVLQGNQATATAVLAALEHCDWLQVCAHAQFDLDDAFASRLLLADGSSLTLAQWLPVLSRHAPSRVVLSACETAVARVTALPDEAIGFPTALVEHGVRSVVATLWPVEDVAAALVVAGYYQALATSDVSHAEALRRGQHALRTFDVRTLMDWLEPMREAQPRVAAVAARLRTRLRAYPPEHRPFADPLHWAPFVLVGG